MALRGAVPLGTPAKGAGTRLTRSAVAPWKIVELAWGGARHRSLLLYAIFISGVFAGFALPSMVTQPPDYLTLQSLRYLSCVLFAAGVLAAPTNAHNRALALFALLAFTLMIQPRSLIAAGELGFQVTYGMQDALRFASVGALMAYWLTLRMRHPISCIITMGLYSIVCGLHFLFGSTLIRSLAVPSGLGESDVSHDEAYIWSVTLVLTVPMLFFCAWIDSYVRSAVPLYGIEYKSRMHDLDPKADTRYLQGWVAFWLFIDVWAVERASRVLRTPAALKADREWYARTLLAISSTRLVIVMLVAVSLTIVLVNQTYRPF